MNETILTQLARFSKIAQAVKETPFLGGTCQFEVEHSLRVHKRLIKDIEYIDVHCATIPYWINRKKQLQSELAREITELENWERMIKRFVSLD